MASVLAARRVRGAYATARRLTVRFRCSSEIGFTVRTDPPLFGSNGVNDDADSAMNLTNRVRAVVRRYLGVTGRDPVEPGTRFAEDLGADRLAMDDLTLALEEAFDVDIPDDEIPACRTVQDAIDCVLAHLARTPRGRPDTVQLSRTTP